MIPDHECATHLTYSYLSVDLDNLKLYLNDEDEEESIVGCSNCREMTKGKVDDLEEMTADIFLGP